MGNQSDQTTIFYRLKLKRTRTPAEVFEKMRKSVKPRGATKRWCCTLDDAAQAMMIDFGDESSETFRLAFDDKKVCDGFCKVVFPLSGELFEDEKKSEFKALMNMLYSARASFAEMRITDDYGIAESYLDSKVNKIAMRELTAEELARAERLYAAGYTDIRTFITALMYDYRELSYAEDFLPFINSCGTFMPLIFWEQSDDISDFYGAFADSFLLETTEYRDQGRLYAVPDYYGELNGVYFAVAAFVIGVRMLTGYRENGRAWDPKSAQVLRFYKGKYLPLLSEADAGFPKCIAAYRFFVSMMEYLGFRYAGKSHAHTELIGTELAEGIRAMLERRDYAAFDAALTAYQKNHKGGY